MARKPVLRSLPGLEVLHQHFQGFSPDENKVVGLPVYSPGFVFGTYLRSFYIRLEEELRRFNFVADFIF